MLRLPAQHDLGRSTCLPCLSPRPPISANSTCNLHRESQRPFATTARHHQATPLWTRHDKAPRRRRKRVCASGGGVMQPAAAGGHCAAARRLRRAPPLGQPGAATCSRLPPTTLPACSAHLKGAPGRDHASHGAGQGTYACAAASLAGTPQLLAPLAPFLAVLNVILLPLFIYFFLCSPLQTPGLDKPHPPSPDAHTVTVPSMLTADGGWEQGWAPGV